MRLDTSGNLLVGTTSAGARLRVQASDTLSTTYGIYVTDSSGNLMLGTRNDGYVRAPVVYSQTAASAANVYVDSSGYLYRSTASASASGTLIRAPQILTSGTSYTTPSNCNSIYVEAVGGGGGGGMGNGSNPYGVPGSAGAYVSKYFSVSSSTSYSYAIGAAGTGATSNGSNGSSGGSTTFTVSGTTVTATGGNGGGYTTQTTGQNSGVTATNGDLNASSMAGYYWFSNTYIAVSYSIGGSTAFGSGGGSGGISDATGYGAGGGGSVSTSNRGGNGSKGFIRIWEYT